MSKDLSSIAEKYGLVTEAEAQVAQNRVDSGQFANLADAAASVIAERVAPYNLAEVSDQLPVPPAKVAEKAEARRELAERLDPYLVTDLSDLVNAEAAAETPQAAKRLHDTLETLNALKVAQEVADEKGSASKSGSSKSQAEKADDLAEAAEADAKAQPADTPDGAKKKA